MATTPKKAAPKAASGTNRAKAPAKTATPKVAAAKAKAASAEPQKPLAEEARELVSQAGVRAKKAANTGKEKAAVAIGDMATMVEDVAKTLDEKVGPQYGDYARKAASTVSGIADSLNAKDVEQLLDDARDFVRKKPAVAIGAAAAVGFLLTRLIRAGDDDQA